MAAMEKLWATKGKVRGRTRLVRTMESVQSTVHSSNAMLCLVVGDGATQRDGSSGRGGRGEGGGVKGQASEERPSRQAINQAGSL